MRERITNKMGLNGKVYGSFDVVGDIAIIKMPTFSKAEAKIFAKAIMDCNRGIITVLAQFSKVSGNYRVRSLVHVAGERKTQTVHREHGCVFVVDLEKCYFSPRLSGERLRMTGLVKPNESIVNMFAGVGCFSILIARRVPSGKVYSIDVNPYAFEFMEKNVKLNRVFDKVVPILGDSKEIVQSMLQNCADRVLMPLPEKAIGYLPVAVSALKHGAGWIHCHCFEHAAKGEEPAAMVEDKIREFLSEAKIAHKVCFSRVVRSVGPNWHHVVADVRVGSVDKF